MRYLGLLAAIVVMVCIFAYVTRLPTTGSQANSQDYGTTVNAVRESVRNSAGAEQRRKWAIALQMKTEGPFGSMSYTADGENAETLVVRSDSMDLTTCSSFVKGENGTAAAEMGFSRLSCRTTSNGIIQERDLR
jgi:hypothetical protein